MIVLNYAKKDSSFRKIKLSEGMLMTVAIVAKVEQRGPSVKCVDRWPMVKRDGTNWQNQRKI